MRRSFLLLVCVMALLAGGANAQQPGYGPATYLPLVDAGGNYRIVATAPYYTPGFAAAGYYAPGYSPVYYSPRSFRLGFAAPDYSPFSQVSPADVYYIVGYRGYLQPAR